MKVNYDFSQRVVLIAGAGSGIGLAMTHACLAAGATVLASDIHIAALTGWQHPLCHVTPLDITDSAAVNHYVKQQCAQHQRIDAAVLASGIQQRIPVEDMTDADWQRHMDVNLTGIFYLVRALFTPMKQQRSGSMVVFTSGLARCHRRWRIQSRLDCHGEVRCTRVERARGAQQCRVTRHHEHPLVSRQRFSRRGGHV